MEEKLKEKYEVEETKKGATEGRRATEVADRKEEKEVPTPEVERVLLG